MKTEGKGERGRERKMERGKRGKGEKGKERGEEGQKEELRRERGKEVPAMAKK